MDLKVVRMAPRSCASRARSGFGCVRRALDTVGVTQVAGGHPLWRVGSGVIALLCTCRIGLPTRSAVGVGDLGWHSVHRHCGLRSQHAVDSWCLGGGGTRSTACRAGKHGAVVAEPEPWPGRDLLPGALWELEIWAGTVCTGTVVSGAGTQWIRGVWVVEGPDRLHARLGSTVLWWRSRSRGQGVICCLERCGSWRFGLAQCAQALWSPELARSGFVVSGWWRDQIDCVPGWEARKLVGSTLALEKAARSIRQRLDDFEEALRHEDTAVQHYLRSVDSCLCWQADGEDVCNVLHISWLIDDMQAILAGISSRVDCDDAQLLAECTTKLTLVTSGFDCASLDRLTGGVKGLGFCPHTRTVPDILHLILRGGSQI
eukprot:COSAG02_NODE_5244_length_4508_cov_42.946700_1_plen_372_part_10